MLREVPLPVHAAYRYVGVRELPGQPPLLFGYLDGQGTAFGQRVTADCGFVLRL